MTSKQSLGGQATAKISRAAALERYYQNPSICKQCGKTISIQGGQKVKEARAKNFCNSSCAALFNNSKRTKLIKPKKINKEKVLAYRKKIDPNYKTLQERFTLQEQRTKGELFSNKASWQAARSHIQRRARKIYSKSTKPKCCIVCGYDKHYEVCHIKSVASFSNTATTGEINDIANLVALCPTHHWEFDKGLLDMVAAPGFQPGVSNL